MFKLQYKTHVYFFRAENEYTFFRYGKNSLKKPNQMHGIESAKTIGFAGKLEPMCLPLRPFSIHDVT